VVFIAERIIKRGGRVSQVFRADRPLFNLKSKSGLSDLTAELAAALAHPFVRILQKRSNTSAFPKSEAANLKKFTAA